MNDLLNSPWFPIIFFGAIVFMVFKLKPNLFIFFTNQPPQPQSFSLNDVSYGFIVDSVDIDGGIFKIEYLPNLQSSLYNTRTDSVWYKIDGLPNEVLTVGKLFKTRKGGDGDLLFQEVELVAWGYNDLGGKECLYKDLEIFYTLPSKYLQNEAAYKQTSLDWVIDSL